MIKFPKLFGESDQPPNVTAYSGLLPPLTATVAYGKIVDGCDLYIPTTYFATIFDFLCGFERWCRLVLCTAHCSFVQACTHCTHIALLQAVKAGSVI